MKKSSLILTLVLAALFLKWCSTGFAFQEHLDNHQNIGKKVQFNQQPISYIQRETLAIVPIVAKIKNEITGLHIKYNSEKENEYIPSNTTFIVEDAYAYRDLLNKRSIYYVLSNQGKKYILGEGSFYGLQKPVYDNAKVPIEVLDKLYKNKPFATSTIRFYLTITDGRYYDVFSTTKFKECRAQNIINNKTDITATVNFDQLSCLYSKLWDTIHSERYPVKYEVLE